MVKVLLKTDSEKKFWDLFLHCPAISEKELQKQLLAPNFARVMAKVQKIQESKNICLFDRESGVLIRNYDIKLTPFDDRLTWLEVY